MPVLLGGEADIETWLSGPQAEAFALARSYDPGALRIVQSGFEKKDFLAAINAKHSAMRSERRALVLSSDP
jgi:hypothetical protein